MAERPSRSSILSSRTNTEINALKAFGDVPASFGTLIDVGTDQFSTTLIVYNATNQDITLNIAETSTEIPMPAGLGITQYPFPHNGIIQYKYTSSAPTSGYLLIKSW